MTGRQVIAVCIVHFVPPAFGWASGYATATDRPLAALMWVLLALLAWPFAACVMDRR